MQRGRVWSLPERPGTTASGAARVQESFFIRGQFLTQPCAGHCPVAFYGTCRYSELERDLFEGQTSKDIGGRAACATGHVFDQRHLKLPVSALSSVMGPGMIDQDVTHYVGSKPQ